MTEIRPELSEIFVEVFHYEEPLSLETSPDQVSRWDSLRHVALVAALEDTFGLSLTMDEMMEIRSVKDIETVLARHGV